MNGKLWVLMEMESFFCFFFLLEREADVAVEGGGGEMSGLWSDQ